MNYYFSQNKVVRPDPRLLFWEKKKKKKVEAWFLWIKFY